MKTTLVAALLTHCVTSLGADGRNGSRLRGDREAANDGEIGRDQIARGPLSVGYVAVSTMGSNGTYVAAVHALLFPSGQRESNDRLSTWSFRISTVPAIARRKPGPWRPLAACYNVDGNHRQPLAYWRPTQIPSMRN
jgi:hypothetical protein